MSTLQRADLSARLQAAVAERDPAAARRFADQLVHRRGVVALEALLQGPLAQLQGSEAVDWLRGLVFGGVQPVEAGRQVTPPADSAAGDAAGADAAVVLPQAPARAPRRVVPLPLKRRPSSPAPATAALAAFRPWLPEAGELPQAS